MAVYLNDDLEDLEDDYVDFDGFGVSGSGGGDPSSPNKHKNDTSAAEHKNGKDMQGIPWERLKYSRDQYRQMRLKQYKNYENLSRSHEGSGGAWPILKTGPAKLIVQQLSTYGPNDVLHIA